MKVKTCNSNYHRIRLDRSS